MPEAVSKGPRVSGAWFNSKPLRKVFAAFAAANVEARVVGGAVRNALIDRPVSDVDIATTAEPEDVIRLARKAGLGAYPTGIDHGTITVVADGVSFEVTTLRRDVETDGRHAVVAFTTSWEEDAKRRDFTINALYCGEDGTIYDPIGGLDDLRKRRVRFIGDAEARIREDYLRILRFFRFSADYGNGQLDPAGLAAVTALKDGLSRLAAERIRSEILKLLAAPKAAEVVRAHARQRHSGVRHSSSMPIRNVWRGCRQSSALSASRPTRLPGLRRWLSPTRPARKQSRSGSASPMPKRRHSRRRLSSIRR